MNADQGYRRARRTLLALALACWGLLGAPGQAQAQAPAPIRIGLMTVKSGAAAGIGTQMEDGFTLFLKQRNYLLGGRKVELIVADTAANPAVAKTKLQELVERNKVNVLVGPLATFEALAIDDNVRLAGVPLILSSATAEDLTQRKPNPLVVRSSSSSAQASHALGEYAVKTLGYKRVAIVGEDLAFSHELIAGFQRTFEEAGGKVVQKLWSPFNASDFASYIAQIKPDVDAVFVNFSGANAIRFLKQYREFSQQGGKPLLAGMNTVDESILPAIGDAAAGIVTAGWYSAAIDTPENRQFVDAYQREFKADPGFYSTGGYSAGLLLEAAVKAVNGKVEDRTALARALHGASVAASPRGPIRLDGYGNPVATVYIRKTARVNGRLQNSVVATIHNVSQFWTYEPRAFLAAPVYSRDYPPARNLE